MGLFSINTDVAGQIGINPRRVKMISFDNLATVTTAGYLGVELLGGFPVYPTDIFDVIYSYVQATNSGSYSELVPSIVNGVITLVQQVSSGNVLLPVVANHIAAFNGTTGQITGDVATAINGGNIQAGLSGTAGKLTSFPATAATGSLSLVAVSDSGNFANAISNASTAQATTWSLADPGSATANILETAAALVSGNIPQASGTAGLIVDSGVSVASVSAAIAQLGVLNQASITLNPTQMAAAYATPVALIAAPGAGKVIQIISAAVYTASTGNTAYATGTAPIVQYGATIHGGGTLATGAGLVAGDITAAASQVRTLGPMASAALTGQSNVGIFFSNATNAYTAGTGTNVTFTFVYQVLTATI